MSKLNEYILNTYDGASDWFVEECKSHWQSNRILNALDNKEYLSGKHAIKKRIDEVHNGKTYKTKKICLQYAKTLLNFETAFALKNPVTLTSNNIDDLELFKSVYREGKYDRLDYKALSKMVKQGEVYEYLYIDDNKRIKSMLFNAEDSYPIYDHTQELIGFIHFYIFDNVSYYTIYSEHTVEEYNDRGGELHLKGEYTNFSGLPIPYILSSEMDELVGQASFREYIDILDAMEELISKNFDAFYKFLSPTPIFKGAKLNQKDGGIDENSVGFALQLTEESSMTYESAKMDYQSYKEIFKTLKQALLDISMTPAVTMSQMEISNISETSIKILYSMAEIKGSINSMHLSQGFEKRWGIMKHLLRILGNDVAEDTYISCQYNYNIPQNEKDIIENIKNATEGGFMSIDRAVEVNPMVNDVNSELDKLKVIDEVDVDEGIEDIEE